MLDALILWIQSNQGAGVIIIVVCLLSFAALIYDVEQQEKKRRLTQKPSPGKMKSMKNVNFVIQIDVGEERVVPASSLIDVTLGEDELEVTVRNEDGTVETIEAYAVSLQDDE